MKRHSQGRPGGSMSPGSVVPTLLRMALLCCGHGICFHRQRWSSVRALVCLRTPSKPRLFSPDDPGVSPQTPALGCRITDPLRARRGASTSDPSGSAPLPTSPCSSTHVDGPSRVTSHKVGEAGPSLSPWKPLDGTTALKSSSRRLVKSVQARVVCFLSYFIF